MITGKELHGIYVACSREDGVYMPTWEGSHPNGHRLYDRVAKKLNEGHVTPLQGELYELREKFSVLRDDKNEVITRLKRLTKDYQRLLRLTPDIDDSANIASWQAYKEELTKRAEQLLGGE